MKLFLVLLQLFTPLHIYAQQADGREISGTYAPGLFHSRNYVKNPGAEKNVLYTTNSASIVTRTTSTPVMGVASYLIDGTSSAQTVKFDTGTLDNNLKGQNCEARFTFTGDASLYVAYVEQGSTKITPNLTLTNETNARDVSINFPCGDLSSNSHLVIETTSASAAAIKVDDVYLGKVTNLGYGNYDTDWVSWTPTGTWSTNTTYTGKYRRVGDSAQFSVKVSLSGAPSSTFSVTLPVTIDTSKLNSTSIAEASFGQGHANDSGTNTYIGDVVYASSTSVNMVGSAGSAALWSATVPFSFGSGDTVILEFTVPVLGWSGQNAIKTDQTNYGPTSFTPSTVGSQGFGTIAAESCFHQRSGKHLIINCKITAGTVAASEARITLPSSLTISTTEVPALRLLEGYWIRSTASATTVKRGTLIGNGGNAYINFSNDDYTGTVNPLVAQNGNAIFSNSDVISFYARIPITGWQENQNAPLLVGSVTSGASGSIRIGSAIVAGGSSTSDCSSTPCTLYNNNDGLVSTATRASAGNYTVNFNTGIWSSAPNCVCTPGNNASVPTCELDAPSTSSVGVLTRAAGVGVQDNSFTIICIGPR